MSSVDPSSMRSSGDFFTADFFADPAPTYRAFREIDPVYELPFDLNLEQAQAVAGMASNTWFVTGHEESSEVLRKPNVYSSSLPAPDGRAMTEAEQGRLVLINSDPPRHTGLRQMVNRAFTPRKVADFEPMIAGLVDELVSEVRRGEPVDVMPLLCEPLPTVVIARLLGVAADRHEDFRRWSDAMIAMADPATIEENLKHTASMHEFFVDEVASRRVEPRDDLVSLFATAEVNGAPLEPWEAISFCVLMLLAGNETTRSLLGSMLARLAERPDLWGRLRDDRSLVEATVEEALRMDSPVQMLNRWTTEDVELGGHQIAARTNVAVAYAAANHDPAVFADPDRFDIDRGANRHIAFGHGVHLCVGAPLARIEAKIVLERLLDEFDSLELSPPGVQYQASSRVVRGPRSLPVRFG